MYFLSKNRLKGEGYIKLEDEQSKYRARIRASIAGKDDEGVVGGLASGRFSLFYRFCRCS